MHFFKKIFPELLLLSILTAGAASAQFISIVSGDGQVVTQNNIPQNPMVVVVRNAQGQPVPGAPVTWTLNGQGSLLNGFTTTTDSNGMSTNSFLGALLFNLSFAQTVITASAAGSSVSFTETTSAIDPTSNASLVQAAVIYPGLGTVLSGPSGSVGSTPVQVQIFGTGISAAPVPNVVIRLIPVNTSSGPQIACSGNTGYTNSMGNTNCLPIFSGPPGNGQYTIDVGGGYRTFGPYPFTVKQGTVSAFRISGGNNQSGAPGATVPLPLTAQTQDAAGNPLPNVPVTWTVLTPNTATITASSSSSDANGNVTATVKLGMIIGPVQIQLSSPQGGTPIVFTLQVNVQVTGVTTIAGDNQDAIVNTTFAQPLVVQVNSSQGPAVGAQVQFTSTGAIPVLFPNGPTATTASNGQASVAIQAGPSAGTAIVTASIGGFSASFTLTIRPPGPAITTSSFFSAAGGQPTGGITPASLTAIYGAGIASGIQGCVTGPETFGAQPLLIAGDTVLFTEGSFSGYGPILSVCNTGVGQEYLVVQVPAELPLGAASVTVRSGIGSKTVDGVLVLPASPGVFETPMSDGQKRAVLQHADGTFVSLENKAQRGEKLRAYVTGLGRPVSASGVLIGTNQSGIAGDDAAPQVPVVAGVADEGVAVDSAVYSSDLIGVYIVTFTVPSDAPSGNDIAFTIAVNLNGNLTFSNGSKIPIQ